MLGQLLETLSGHWADHLESRVPRTELYEARIASSKPSLGFFLLLISSAVIASLGLISNSAAVVIGAMIVAPLMDPHPQPGFWLGCQRWKIDPTFRRHHWLRRSGGDWNRCVDQFGTWDQPRAVGDHGPHVSHLIDLGIAIAAAVAGSFSMTRKQLSNSIAGVAIAAVSYTHLRAHETS